MIFYDISRDGIGVAPMLLTLMWLGGVGVGIWVGGGISQIRHRPNWVWLVAWTIMGGLGFGHVWYRHVKLVRELESGHYRVVEGRITSFRPQEGKMSEQFTVAGVTFHYDSNNLGRGGLRSTGGYDGPLYVGAYARVTYDADSVILRLEAR